MLLAQDDSLAQGESLSQGDSIHWAYAAHFGTGRYSLDGQTETAIVSVAPAWSWREPEFGEPGMRQFGYKFRVPIAFGAHEFSSLDTIGDLNLGSFEAISIVPGVEVEIP